MRISQLRSILSSASNLPILSKISTFERSRAVGGKHLPNSLLVTFLVISILTALVGERFYNQPQLSVNSVAPETIKAPKSQNFIDWEATLEKRKESQSSIVPVIERNTYLTRSILSNLEQKLNLFTKFRQQAGGFPFFSTELLSLKSQEYLRKCNDEQWNYFKVNTFNQEFHKKLKSSDLDKLEQIRNIYKATLKEMLALSNEDLDYPIFLDIENSKWIELNRQIKAATKMILIQGLPPGLSGELLRETLGLHLQQLTNPLKNETTNFLVNYLKNKSNLSEDKLATQRLTQQAANSIKPITIHIDKGQTIVEAGRVITTKEFSILDSFKLSRRTINFIGLAFGGLFVTISVALLIILSPLVHHSLRRRDCILFCILSLSGLILNLIDIRFISLPAVGLLASTYYGSTLAIVEVLTLTGLNIYATGNVNWDILIACMVSGLIAAIIAGRLRSRDELALLGLGIGLAQGGVYLLLQLISFAPLRLPLYQITPNAIFLGLVGLAWAVIAIGVSPYLERMFDLVTPIRLSELSNPNCPLLKRLAKEAPGTFQHTLAVASLAESAARSLNCNVELVRAGTLYHDIGKMHDPQGFIENQMGSTNKHDEINNPLISAEIIKKHVSQGLVIARKYQLPKVIQDFIPEHQGTLLISYFYYQAQQKLEDFNEASFRYDGPIPQSRETGIVMLADSCEAALRSLKDTTPEIALSMVKKILRARWQENQLGDSEILYEELPIIANVFVEVWQQFNHSRIAYPKGVLEPPSLPH